MPKVNWPLVFLTYGLTKIEWLNLFKKQGMSCALCKSRTPKTIKGWHTDHNHETGIVRGILCLSCNVQLGTYEKFKRNPLVEKYLDKGTKI